MQRMWDHTWTGVLYCWCIWYQLAAWTFPCLEHPGTMIHHAGWAQSESSLVFDGPSQYFPLLTPPSICNDRENHSQYSIMLNISSLCITIQDQSVNIAINCSISTLSHPLSSSTCRYAHTQNIQTQQCKQNQDNNKALRLSISCSCYSQDWAKFKCTSNI